MTPISPQELSAERLAIHVTELREYIKQPKKFLQANIALDKIEAHIAHLEHKRTESNADNMRLRDSLASAQKALAAEQDTRKDLEQRLADESYGTRNFWKQRYDDATQERDRLREALRTILKRWENGDIGVEYKWDAIEIYAEISNAIAALAQPQEQP